MPSVKRHCPAGREGNVRVTERMNVRRYQICASPEIGAPAVQIYALASDPEMVPVHAPEAARIEVVRRLSEHRALVKSYLKVAGGARGRQRVGPFSVRRGPERT